MTICVVLIYHQTQIVVFLTSSSLIFFKNIQYCEKS